ncbi:MAG: hypothetical protein V4641_16450 [Pseudomonadota bacterium]
MTQFQITPPELMPISLERARLALRMDDDDTHLDEEIEDFIVGVAQELENTIGQSVMVQTWRVKSDGWGDDGFQLPHPARSLVSVTYRAENGASVVLDPSSYRIIVERYESSLVAAAGVTLPVTDGSADAVTIDVVVGMASTQAEVPPAIRLYLRQRIKQQFDPAARMERDTVQSNYTEDLLQQFKVKP